MYAVKIRALRRSQTFSNTSLGQEQYVHVPLLKVVEKDPSLGLRSYTHDPLRPCYSRLPAYHSIRMGDHHQDHHAELLVALQAHQDEEIELAQKEDVEQEVDWRMVESS